MKINEAVHVALFHVGEGRKQDGRGGGGGSADKKFTRKGAVRQSVHGLEGRSGNLKKAMAKKVETHTTRRDRKELQ